MNELLSEPWVISVVTSLVTALFLSVSKLIEIAFTEKRRIAAELSRERIKAMRMIKRSLEKSVEIEDISTLKPIEMDSLGLSLKNPTIALLCGSVGLRELSDELYSVLEDCQGSLGIRSRAALVKLHQFQFRLMGLYKELGLPDHEFAVYVLPVAEPLKRYIKKIDKLLVRDVNKTKLKYESDSGVRWFFWIRVYSFQCSRMEGLLNGVNAPNCYSGSIFVEMSKRPFLAAVVNLLLISGAWVAQALNPASASLVGSMGTLVGAMIPFLLVYLYKEKKARSFVWDIVAILFVWLISFMVSLICLWLF